MIKKIYQFFQSIVVLLMWPTLLLACLELMIHVFTVLVLDDTFSLGLTSPFKNFFVGKWLVQDLSLSKLTYMHHHHIPYLI